MLLARLRARRQKPSRRGLVYSLTHLRPPAFHLSEARHRRGVKRVPRLSIRRTCMSLERTEASAKPEVDWPNCVCAVALTARCSDPPPEMKRLMSRLSGVRDRGRGRRSRLGPCVFLPGSEAPAGSSPPGCRGPVPRNRWDDGRGQISTAPEMRPATESSQSSCLPTSCVKIAVMSASCCKSGNHRRRVDIETFRLVEGVDRIKTCA